MKRIHFAFALILAALLSLPAQAQTWPTHTIRIVVPYAPGGGVSILAQLVSAKLSALVKQPVVIDNRPGAGGNLGADLVAKSAHDGYTFLMHTSSHASASALYSKLSYDPVKDFVPVTMVVATQFVVAGSLKDPATSLRELAAEAKAKPGVLNYGSSGAGSTLHLFGEIFKSAAGLDIVHIPYRGDAPLITALISGEVQLAFLPQPTGQANVEANMVRALAVTGTQRMTSLPNVPTTLEQGYAGMEGGSWEGLFAPAGTPADIVEAMQRHIATALADPQVRASLLAVGQEPVGNSPAEFDAQFKADIARYAKVIEQAKIPKLD